MKLMKHQIEILNKSKHYNKVAYYLDMGLGKTYLGSAKLDELNSINNLLICQKSKISDWEVHFKTNHPAYQVFILNNIKGFNAFIQATKNNSSLTKLIGIINYDLTFRREDLKSIQNYTLMLDESSLIQNQKSKRSKFITKLKFKNLILLSGTPTNGKYENLMSQIKMLGWNISKKEYWDKYIEWRWLDLGAIRIPKVLGYKNVDDLKLNLKFHGCSFMKTEEVLDLPEQRDITIDCDVTTDYKYFLKHGIITMNDGKEILGENSLTLRLGLKLLSGKYNIHKLTKIKELFESTEDRLIVFYNYTSELNELLLKAKETGKAISIVNGKTKDLDAYDNNENSVTFIQYQAGAMGLNLQKANVIIFFSLSEAYDLYAQARKRIHRIGQNKKCTYYHLLSKNTIDYDIMASLIKKENYTDDLFIKKYGGVDVKK